MGLLQKACETYDCFERLAGVAEEGKIPLAPIAHTLTSADVEITIDGDGRFVSARRVDKKEPKIIVPVTEESAGRSSGARAHPLCDYLEYIAPDNEEKHSLYTEQLADWARSEYSTPKLRAILEYVLGGTITADLAATGVVERDENGQADGDKLFVRWVVSGLGLEQSGPCWNDPELFRSFIDYYMHKRDDGEKEVCMISGADELPAEQHPKGIIPIYGNARLVSSNDTSNFTFRGRFGQGWQAATVGYTASHKAHNALRWIAANQGVRVSLPGDADSEWTEGEKNFTTFGGRTFLCWNPRGIATIQPFGRLSPKKGSAGVSSKPSDYEKQLKETLRGWKADLPQNEGVVLAAFDAATTGRLAVTYYSELLASDFLDRLYYWDSTCCWYNGEWGVQSPPLFQIANLAYGTPREGRFVCDVGVLKQQMQRLLSCRVDRSAFPLDLERRLAQRATLLATLGADMRERLLFTACACIQKYYFDRNETRWNMQTDLNTLDRSFQFGRLLAVLERTEQYYYWSTGENKPSDKDGDSGGRVDRETNAIRMLNVYCQRPFGTYGVIDRKLRTAYLPRMKPWQKEQYLNLTGEIVSRLNELGCALDRPLSDKYLLGYHLQRLAMKTKKNTDIAEEE